MERERITIDISHGQMTQKRQPPRFYTCAVVKERILITKNRKNMLSDKDVKKPYKKIALIS